MEKSPCEKCKVKNCSRYKECERWKKRMREYLHWAKEAEE